LFSLEQGRNTNAKGYAVRLPVSKVVSGTFCEAATDACVEVTRGVDEIGAEKASANAVTPRTADVTPVSLPSLYWPGPLSASLLAAPALGLFSLKQGRNASAKGYAVRLPVSKAVSGTFCEAATDVRVRVTCGIVKIGAEKASANAVRPITADVTPVSLPPLYRQGSNP